MNRNKIKLEQRHRRHRRVRRRVHGSADRPRLTVYRSLNHMYAQVVDDDRGVTLLSASTIEPSFRESRPRRGNVAAAKEIGKEIAGRAKALGISKVVFDRGGYKYHGRVKAVADGAREAGLQF